MYTPSISIHPSSHEITIGFVRSLFGYCNVLRMKTNRATTNTNTVIMTKLYGVSFCAIICGNICVIICLVSCCVNKNKFPCPINYIMYDGTMRTVQQSIALFASLLLVLLLLLIVIYDCVGVYDK